MFVMKLFKFWAVWDLWKYFYSVYIIQHIDVLIFMIIIFLGNWTGASYAWFTNFPHFRRYKRYFASFCRPDRSTGEIIVIICNIKHNQIHFLLQYAGSHLRHLQKAIKNPVSSFGVLFDEANKRAKRFYPNLLYITVLKHQVSISQFSVPSALPKSRLWSKRFIRRWPTLLNW